MTTGCHYEDSDDNELRAESAERNADENMKRKIPKLFRRTFHGEKKSDSFCKKAKKPLSKDSSLQNSLLDLDAQFKVSQNILDLQDRTGLSMVQKNGQRKLGPPCDWTGPPPEPGCEVFVGRIPRNIYEDVIYPIFNSVGEIYEIRLMMNFSGTNRGFCFIMFTKPEYAKRAIRELNNYEIRPGWCIGVVASVNNCRLHVTDLPSHIDAHKLMQKIWPVCEDIDKVSVYTSKTNPKMKHALISFKTHRSAAMARRRLVPEQGSFFDKSDVRIEWAHPKMLISDVIEECSYCDENGKITITTKHIPHEKKNLKTKKRSFQNSSKMLTTQTAKNVQTVNYLPKVILQKDFTSRLISNTSYDKSEGVCKVEQCNKNYYYVDQPINNNVQPRIQQFDVNQNVCVQDNGSFDHGSIKCFDQLKYSMRSDESLSDFSRSSDFNDSKYSYCPIDTSTPYRKVIAPFLNPSDCSVVQIPWGYYSVNQAPNIYDNFNFHTIRFPWHLMKVASSNSCNVPLNVRPMQNHLITNVPVPRYVVNNVKHVEQFRSCQGVNKTARPILNRKTLFH